jgi:hypothetical protein
MVVVNHFLFLNDFASCLFSPLVLLLLTLRSIPTLDESLRAIGPMIRTI